MDDKTLDKMFVALVASASGFTVPSGPILAPRAQARVSAPVALLSPADLPMDFPFSAIAEILDQEGERIYGAVDAPGWIAPIGGIALISTALLPM